MRSRLLAAAGALGLAAGLTVLVAPGRSAPDAVVNGCVQSVPEPGTSEPVDICYTLYRPAGATSRNPVPLVMHSHGWGGKRTTSPAAFAKWLDAGFGVLSFDQRGFGESGGLAHIQNPDFEGRDVVRLVDFVASLDWVAKERSKDPKLGAIGGSYGGGFQFVGAFTELRERGRTRFDALAPDKTWWDLKESLAPSEVPRTGWAAALFALAPDSLPEEIRRGFAYAAATGNWPKGQDPAAPNLDAFFRRNGPAWHVSEGRRLPIPMLVYQGATDNLFNLNQGIKNFELAMTPRARARSIFVGYNGGHAGPSAFPPGDYRAGDPCAARLLGATPPPDNSSATSPIGSAAGYEEIALRFFKEELKGERPTLPGRGMYHLATQAGGCLKARSIGPDYSAALGSIRTPSGLGAPLFTPVATGPFTVAGIPELEASVTTLGLDTRIFLGLAVGSTPADARVVQNNLMPLHEPAPVVSAARRVELPGVAVEVPPGQRLYLVVSGFYDMSFANGARTPGAVALDNVVLRLNASP